MIRCRRCVFHATTGPADERALNASASWLGRPYAAFMFGRQTPSPPEHPAVGLVEVLLSRAATFRETTPSSGRGLPVSTTHAVWICPCVAMDDAPTWLVYEDVDHEVMWCRVPDGADVWDVIDAKSMSGGHADPAAVLEWLEGDASDPWAGGDGRDDGGLLARLARKLGHR